LISEAQFVTESKTKSTSTYSNDFLNAQYASYYEGTFSGTFSQTWVYNSIGPDFYTDGTGTFSSPSGISTTSKITFAPKKKQYQLPMTYNSNWNSSGTQTVATTLVLPFIGNQTTTLVQNYSVETTVDGYGTVKMPGGKILNALRIKSVTNLTANAQTTTTVNYLILTKTGESVSITVKDVNATTGVVAIDAINWTNGDGISNPSTNTVTTSSNPSNGGTTSGGGTFNAGSNVTLVATPNSGFTFTNWTEGGTVLSTSASYTFALNSNRTLAANFAAVQFITTTSSNPSNGGTTSGSGTSSSGSNVIVVATPNSGFIFTNWTEGGTVVSTSSSYAFSASKNRALVANFTSATSIQQIGELPTRFSLSQNYPNPFNPTTTIHFNLPNKSMVQLSVYNSLGQEIVKLVNQELNIGIYSLSFDGSNLSSGIYFYQLRTENVSNTKRMVMIK